MENLIGKKVITDDGVEGVIRIYEKDEIGRDTIRIKITKGDTSVTDYFLKDVKVIK